jgi:tetratricopeptide (TPR) repeat protein
VSRFFVLTVLGDAGRVDVGAQCFSKRVMARHAVLLATFLMQPARPSDAARPEGIDQQSPELLNETISIERNNADVQHALGRLLVRRHEYARALDLLRRAHELAPDNARDAYVYAIALNSTGAPAEAKALFEQAHQRHPADRDVLDALGLDRARHRGFWDGAAARSGAGDPRSCGHAASLAGVGSRETRSPLAGTVPLRRN